MFCIKKRSQSLLLLIGLIFCNVLPIEGQDLSYKIPADKNVRIGKLSNGLTYYIRHNAIPEKRVDFYLVQKVGSILEEPQQRGLAHFVEHMAFNGTKNFPGDNRGAGLAPWCESKGIKLGEDLNAFTAVDQTVYNIINVPTDQSNVVDSCLLILHDWSGDILLNDEEIEKERGVVREEWRSTTDASMRLFAKLQPEIYKDSKYADCMPIGNIDVINTFPTKEIKDFYKKWYRPDLQGVVIVGDINVDEIEEKIKKTFANVKAPVSPAERIKYKIADNKEPIVVIGSDKEINFPSFSVNYSYNPTPDSLKNRLDYYARCYTINMVTKMLNSRLDQICEKEGALISQAHSKYGFYFITNARNALSIKATSGFKTIELALYNILEELERARRFGFTASEYERAKVNYLKTIETDYVNREKKESALYAIEYIRHFIYNEPIPNNEDAYTIMCQLVPNITVEQINEILPELITDENQVVYISGPDRPDVDYPSKQDVLDMLKNLKSSDLKPYAEEVLDKPLMAVKPKGGKIVSEEKDELYGSTKLTLSNGVVVYVKKTDFITDEILFKGLSFGGLSYYSDKDVLNLTQINTIPFIGGLGEFTNTELSKVLAGKKAKVTANVDRMFESIEGNCSPKDFETFMQLIHLTFTAPRKDEAAFQYHKKKLLNELYGLNTNAMKAFSDSLYITSYEKNPRVILLKMNMIKEINYDRIMEIYKNRFKDANDFTFFFVGNIDLEKSKPLIAEYLGSLPALNSKEPLINDHVYTRNGLVINKFQKEQETPRATVYVIQKGKINYDLKNIILADYMSALLKLVYNSEIRENEGGTYSIQCWAESSKYPQEESLLNIFFQTDPAKQEKLLNLALTLLEKMGQEGPSSENMQKVREHLLKSYNDDQRQNDYWLKNFNEYFYTGVDKTKDYLSILNSITGKDVQVFVNDLIQQKNRVQIIMTTPEEDKK